MSERRRPDGKAAAVAGAVKAAVAGAVKAAVAVGGAAVAIAVGMGGAAVSPACGGAQAPGGGRPVSLVLPALDGGEIDVRAYRGKVVVLHLFTTWSLAAQSDVEQLVRVGSTVPDTVQVIGVALDEGGYRLVAPWRNSNDIKYLIALGGDWAAAGARPVGRVFAVPTTVVLDRRGVIARRIDRPLAPGELARVVSALGAGQ